LEARVRERTAQLEVANQELDTFAYSVSHDLKAPLRGIDGYSRLLLEDYVQHLDDEGRLFVENIRRGTQRMGVLIDDLLAYSRMERRVLHRNALDPRRMIEGIVTGCADELCMRGATVRVSLPAALQVQADPEGLAQVLRNLMDNALKFGRAGVPACRCRLTLGGVPVRIRPCSGCGTTASVLTRSSMSVFLRSFSACNAPKTTPAPGSVWRLRARRCSAWAGAFGRKARPARAQPFSWNCRPDPGRRAAEMAA